MRASPRTVLFLHALALAALAVLVLLALGLPAVVRGRFGAATLVALALALGMVLLVAGAAMLFRGVARPVDRLLVAAARLEPRGAAARDDLPVLGEPGEASGPALERAAVAFERLVGALAAERVRLAAKVEELTAANRELAQARASLLRSEKLATVGRLASGLAHEVGNPLGAVRGYVDLARARLPAGADPALADALSRIEEAAVRIDRTVRELLDFARPTAPLLAPLALPPVIEGALRLARVQERFRDVEVELDLPPALGPILGDEHQVSQVLLNLLLNAGDAMRGAGRVRVAARAAGGGRIAVRVEDAGPGIAPGDLPHVFDPFFTTKEPGAGTGLGLAIGHRIMESLGGEIAAWNAEGGGAVFELRFRAC